MLQVRMLSNLLRTPDGDLDDNYSGTALYHEPGFTQMSPLELEFPKSDQVTMKFRKRDGTGTYTILNKATLEVTVVDPTNGRNVPYTMRDASSRRVDLTITNALNLLATIAIVRVRVLDVNVRDTDDDDFVTFRILVDDDDRLLNYIFVDANRMVERNSFSSQGKDIYLSTKSGSDNYLLFSPYAFIKETTSDKASFSYPLDTIFYKRQESYNNEDYSYSISLYSHTFVRDLVSILNVPSYNKAGVLLIDNKMYTDILERNVNPYIDIVVVGELSGYSDTFRINFTT